MAVRVCSTQLDHASDPSAGRDEVGMESDLPLYFFPAERDWQSSSGRDIDLSDERPRPAGLWSLQLSHLFGRGDFNRFRNHSRIGLRPLFTGRAISPPHALVSVSICGRSALEDRSISSETLFLAGCGLDVSCFDRPGCWTAISYRRTGVTADTF